jgi:threonine dehydratase
MEFPSAPDPQFIAALTDTVYPGIQDHLVETPILFDSGSGLWLKCENLQTTGSFKLRGALAKLSGLPSGVDVITASTGNHGLGMVTAASVFGQRVIVYLPSSAAKQKKEKLAALGVQLTEVEGDSLTAELAGKEYAIRNRYDWVSPYNDPVVIAGQGTIALELLEQTGPLDKIYITVGGGGLISGIGSYFSIHSPQTEIIGCLPSNSPEMYLSHLAGHIVTAPEELATLSDGSAGPLEKDCITFPLCESIVDRYLLIDEDDIKKAIRYIFHQHGMVIEGAAGVAFAAAYKDIKRSPEDKAAVILCGGNIDRKIHQLIMDQTG